MINYYLITKPGIILGNLITVAAGFLLASKGVIYLWLFLATLLGIAFIIAAACVFNNYIDRPLDRKMERTKNRPLAAGLISGNNALIFGTVLLAIGIVILGAYTNMLALSIAVFGFLVYVLLYSLWKGHTIYSTAIGSVAGAVPPVVGYCAVSNQLDIGAIILFAMLVLWQMPHFFAIALYRYQDYVTAKVPVLPVIKGVLRTKVHMLIYILAFIPVAMLLTYFNYTGLTYLWVTAVFSIAWLLLCLKGFNSTNNQLWGQNMFKLSLVLITAVCIAMSLNPS